MINKLITLSLQNRLIVLLISVCLFTWGVIALRNNPIDAIPDLSENQVIVFTETGKTRLRWKKEFKILIIGDAVSVTEADARC